LAKLSAAVSDGRSNCRWHRDAIRTDRAFGVNSSRDHLFAFSLACLPGIIAAPAVYAKDGSFFKRLSALCGAIALYAVTGVNRAQALAFGRVARLGLGLCAISFTRSQIFWAILTTIAFALAAIAILITIARHGLRYA
jgi:hypothetical protein